MTQGYMFVGYIISFDNYDWAAHIFPDTYIPLHIITGERNEHHLHPTSPGVESDAPEMATVECWRLTRQNCHMPVQ